MSQALRAICAGFWLIPATLACSNEPGAGGPNDSAMKEVPAMQATVTPSGEQAAQAAAAGSAGTRPASGGAAAPSTGRGSEPAEPRDAGRAEGSPETRASMDAPAAPADAAAPPSTDLPPLCSGCAEDVADPMDMTLHLHHVHMNVQDRAGSVQFYTEFLNGREVRLNGASDAVQTEPVLLLLDQVAEPPKNTLPTALQHIGWGSADPVAWYADAHQRGVAPDTRGNTLFTTADTPTVAGPGALLPVLLGGELPACFPTPDEIAYMYVLGPDGERIEVWSGADERVNHLHFTTPDLVATMTWYREFLGVGAPVDAAAASALFFLDDILFFWEPIGEPASYAATDDFVLSHFALSVTDLSAWFARARDLNIEVVAEPAMSHGFMSFFVRAPDGVLLELVQASPSPSLCPSL